MSVRINQDILEDKWNQLRGKVKQKWSKLADDQLDQISGSSDELASLLQDYYGYSIMRAQGEVDDFIRRYRFLFGTSLRK